MIASATQLVISTSTAAGISMKSAPKETVSVWMQQTLCEDITRNSVTTCSALKYCNLIGYCCELISCSFLNRGTRTEFLFQCKLTSGLERLGPHSSILTAL